MIHLSTGESVVYKVTNTVTKDFYIGCTRHGIAAREYQHRNAADNGGKIRLHAAMREFGHDAFVFEEMGNFADDHELALAYESEAVAKYAPPYNVADGGRKKVAVEETPKHLRRVTRKPVRCLNDGRVFSCAREAGGFYGLNTRAINNVAAGGKYRKSIHGLRFEYVVKK